MPDNNPRVQQSTELFDKWALLYDKIIWDLVPPYRKMLKVASELVLTTIKDFPKPKVLDLGIGTANLEKFFLKKTPNIELIGYDISNEMLRQAEEKISGFDVKLHLINSDIRRINLERRYDIVLTTLTLHYVPDKDKKRILKIIYDCLMENGVFILGDRIISKSDFINNLYVQRMKKAIKKVLKKLSEEERIIFDFIDKEEEMPTTLENYLRWLYEIGFQYIECLWREFNYVVLFARRGSVL